MHSAWLLLSMLMAPPPSPAPDAPVRSDEFAPIEIEAAPAPPTIEPTPDAESAPTSESASETGGGEPGTEVGNGIADEAPAAAGGGSTSTTASVSPETADAKALVVIEERQVPRLFETLQGFRPSEVASHSNRKTTVTFIPGLQVRNQVGLVSPFTIDRFGNRYAEGPFTSGRVRINPTLRLGKRQNVDIVLNVDFANGRWAPQGSRDPVIGEILSPDPSTVAHGIPPLPTEVAYVDFRELYVQWDSKIGQFRLGQMAFTWGEGILASSGNWADRFGDMRFGDDGIGKIYERFMFATRPFQGLDSPIKHLIVAVGGDLVFRDDRVDLMKSCMGKLPLQQSRKCDIAGQAFFVLRYQAPGSSNWIGGYAVYRNQTTYDDADVYPDDTKLEVGVGDIAGQGSTMIPGALTLLGSFEGVLIGGRTNAVFNEYGPHRVLQGGAAMRGYIGKPESWLAGFDAGYASGDSNPSDNRLTGFAFDTSAQVGLVLFPAVRGWRSAQSEILATNGELTGVALNGSQFIPNRGAVTNAIYIHPKARWAVQERFEVWGGPLIAMAASPDADPYTSRLAGGDPTNSVGGSGNNRYYGTELDLGMRGRIDIRKLWLQIGVQGGLLLPGKGLANSVGQTDGPTAAMWLRTEIRY